MKRYCSLRLDLIGDGNEWSWRMFYRNYGPNPSIDRSIRIPHHISPSEIFLSLNDKLDIRDISRIKIVGNQIWQNIFPREIRHEVESFESGDILFHLPPEWANIPFELCYISGKGFLGQIFQIGTIICLETEIKIRKELPTHEKLLIIADPTENLPSALQEGLYLKQFAKENGIETHFIASGDKSKILTAIKTSSMVHFAGMSTSTDCPDSTGWLIRPDKVLNLTDIKKMRKSLSAPRFIFSNSCYASISSEDFNLSGIACEFLKIGVSQVIGPVKRINDQDALKFSKSFYKYLFKQMTPANSLHSAKQEMQKNSPNSVTPLFYRLYGDPLFNPRACYSMPEKNQKDKHDTVMKLFVKILVGIALLSVFFLLIKFCADQYTFTVLTSLAEDEFSVFKEIAQQFDKKHSVILRIENKKHDEIFRNLDKDKTIDVIMIDINKRGDVKMEEKLYDLSSERKTLIPSTIHPALIEHLQERELKYLVPFRPNVRLLFVNKQRFKNFFGNSVSFPNYWTWDDILKFSKDVKELEDEVRVIVHGAGDDAPILLIELIYMAGGDPYNLIDNSSMQAIKYLRQLWPYVLAVDWQTATGCLLAERAYIGRNWCFISRNLEKAHQLDSFEVSTGPRWTEVSKPYNLLGGDYLALPKSARHPKRSLEFIQFLISYEVQKKLAKRLWWPPIRTEILRELEKEAKYGPYFRQMKEALIYSYPMPSWWNSEVSKIYSELFTGITNPNKDLDNLVATFQDRIRQLSIQK